jgi:uncharacterized membrane protein YjgN (DUF898 family)
MKLRNFILPIIAAGSISIAAPIIHPQHVAAAGFMENSLKNFTDSPDIDASIKNGIKFLAAILYFVPALVVVATVAGVAVARNAQSDDGVRSVITIGIIVMALVGILWLYDSKMVGQVNASRPRWVQVAMLETLVDMGV